MYLQKNLLEISFLFVLLAEMINIQDLGSGLFHVTACILYSYELTFLFKVIDSFNLITNRFGWIRRYG